MAIHPNSYRGVDSSCQILRQFVFLTGNGTNRINNSLKIKAPNLLLNTSASFVAELMSLPSLVHLARHAVIGFEELHDKLVE
ncbi:hypothetical protein WN943_014317 [Citrus x changshan-huyou]